MTWETGGLFAYLVLAHSMSEWASNALGKSPLLFHEKLDQPGM